MFISLRVPAGTWWTWEEALLAAIGMQADAAGPLRRDPVTWIWSGLGNRVKQCPPGFPCHCERSEAIPRPVAPRRGGLPRRYACRDDSESADRPPFLPSRDCPGGRDCQERPKRPHRALRRQCQPAVPEAEIRAAD